MAKTKANSLTEEWARRYAHIKGYDESIIVKMHNEDALNVKTVKADLIRDGYDTILRDTTLTKAQARLKLADEYNVSNAQVEAIIYNKFENPVKFSCSVCGSDMTRYKHTRNKGVCDMCVIKQSDVKL